MVVRDPFLQAAIDEAKQGLAEGGIPIGSVLVHQGAIIGRGHNRRVQQGSAITALWHPQGRHRRAVTACRRQNSSRARRAMA